MRSKLTLGIITVVCLLKLTSCDCKKSTNPYEAKVDSLLSVMTLQEKIGQLHQLDVYNINDDIIEQVKNGTVGSILNMKPADINEIQRYAVDSSRLHIPLLVCRDVIHGYKTIMPIPLAQAFSWDTTLVAEAAAVAAKEAAVSGYKLAFSPMIDVTHDPRWGRVSEGAGEDCFLAASMGVAMVRGYQGEDCSDKYKVAACAKHFAGYGMSEGGRDYNSAYTSEQQLRDWILPPFEAVAKAGVATFMAGFNNLNGVPVSGSKFLLQQILRDEWGYEGAVISDYFSIRQMATQRFVADDKESAKVGIEVGVDIDMMSFAYTKYLDSLVAEGKVDVKDIDKSVRRVLMLKARLGLFENPYCPIEERDSILYCEEHLNTSKKIAIESAVLVKNDNNILPLSKDIKKVAIIGPLANAPYEQMGTWCFDGEKEHSITPLQAITEEIGAEHVIYAAGLNYSREEKTDFSEAIKAAKNADVALLFVGEESILSGEAKCRSNINLPGSQSKLIEAIKATGKPVVMVVMAGRPLTIGKDLEKADAAFIALHAGTMAGPAISDLIFGKENPSGKITITFPKSVGQIPIYYNDYMTGRPAPEEPTLIGDIPVQAIQTSLGYCSYWLDEGIKPLLPFGFGLSYTTFEYSDIKISSNTISANEDITISCKIKNNGNVDGCEIAQLYVSDDVASICQPVKSLKGFKRINLKAGEEQEVAFTINAQNLAFTNAQMQKVVEPGTFTAWIGPNSVQGLKTSFAVNE